MNIYSKFRINRQDELATFKQSKSILTANSEIFCEYVSTNYGSVTCQNTMFNKAVQNDRKLYENVEDCRRNLTERNNTTNYCDNSINNNIDHSDNGNNNDADKITQIIVDHPWKSRSLEVTMIVISYHHTNKKQSFVLANTIIDRIINADWLSKRILVLLIPTNCGNEFNQDICYNQNSVHTERVGNEYDNIGVKNDIYPVRYSKLLSSWIDQYHFNENMQNYDEANRKNTRNEGIIRDAYVVDFSKPYITTTSVSSKQKKNQKKSKKNEQKNENIFYWDTTQLLVAGNNGQLPNLDFLSAPLALFSDDTISEAEGAFLPTLLVERLNVEQKGKKGFTRSAIITQLAKICTVSVYYQYECERYFKRLEGLFSFSKTLIEGPSGLHGQFIRKNIDAVTLRPIVFEEVEPIDKEIIDDENWVDHDILKLMDMLERMVYIFFIYFLFYRKM